ncbi:hypothetical protein D0862_06865 [Hortaea werneckii]|uniref:Uncharacterized protein n=1 Tax=Hortaea werneckii TaxID=91943 RepID=A0A3M7GG38_HORWE|nr:hypothetical protein D0862_06865 [Hortaea werneckii]
MAEPNDDNALFAIEVDVDDYADTAAADNPSASTTSTNQDDAATVSRTFQSASAFQAQKAAYRAKIDWGDLEADLIKAVPVLCRTTRDPVAGGEEVKLSKKGIQLLGCKTSDVRCKKQDRETARPQDRETARPQDRKTARPQDRKTARPQDCTTYDARRKAQDARCKV